MRQKLRSPRPSHGTVVAYLALFVALGGTTYAATGGNFILGQANTANAPTTLSSGTTGAAFKATNTNTAAGATALGLNVPSGHAPFTVNSGTKVTNLNADKLDGLNSTAFISTSNSHRFNFTASIPAVLQHGCQDAAVTGLNASGDHLVLTPRYDTASPSLEYSAQYTTAGDVIIRACNPWDYPRGASTTDFNLLVIDQ